MISFKFLWPDDSAVLVTIILENESESHGGKLIRPVSDFTAILPSVTYY